MEGVDFEVNATEVALAEAAATAAEAAAEPNKEIIIIKVIRWCGGKIIVG